MKLSDASNTSAPKIRSTNRAGQRILLVDADSGVRRSLRDVLVSEGHVVIPADDGQQALELAAFTPIDIVLFDPAAPATGGWAILERLMLLHAELPLIVLAPSRLNRRARSVSLANANGSGRNPINFAALGTAIERALLTPAEAFIVHCIEQERPRATVLPSFVTAGSFALSSATRIHP